MCNYDEKKTEKPSEVALFSRHFYRQDQTSSCDGFYVNEECKYRFKPLAYRFVCCQTVLAQVGDDQIYLYFFRLLTFDH